MGLGCYFRRVVPFLVGGGALLSEGRSFFSGGVVTFGGSFLF